MRSDDVLHYENQCTLRCISRTRFETLNATIEGRFNGNRKKPPRFLKALLKVRDFAPRSGHVLKPSRKNIEGIFPSPREFRELWTYLPRSFVNPSARLVESKEIPGNGCLMRRFVKDEICRTCFIHVPLDTLSLNFRLPPMTAQRYTKRERERERERESGRFPSSGSLRSFRDSREISRRDRFIGLVISSKIHSPLGNSCTQRKPIPPIAARYS